MDIFLLAKLKGTRVEDLDELRSEDELESLRRKHNRGQKFSKRDYEALKTLTPIDVIKMSETQKIQKEYTDDLIGGENIIKIEKRNPKRKVSKE